MKTFWLFIRGHWFSVTLLTGLLWFLALRIYYRVKPHLPVAVRLGLRRWLARRKRAQSIASWPILESAKTPPRNWAGWPDGRKFAFVLTHDVEGSRGLARVKALAELEMSLGFRSSFNFVPEGSYRVPKELREWLVESGFEVGVHDHKHDGTLYQSHEGFTLAASRINHYLKEWDAVGFRSGFMFHNLEWLKELNVEYDASTFDTDPFEPQSDGTKTIFPFWVGSREKGGYIELPYTLVQDSTLFIMLQEKSNQIWKQKLEWIQSHGGMALLNVHPDYICFDGEPSDSDEFPVRHYAEFLTWLKQNHAPGYWQALPRDVAQFAKQQSAAALTVIASAPAQAAPLLLGL